MKNPVTFGQEVRQEVSKVTPPTRREVIVTSILVFILASIAAIFLFGVDQLLKIAMQAILGVGA